MGKDDRTGKQAAAVQQAVRHPFGPRTLAALLPAITRPAFRRRSPAAHQLLTDWPALAGAAVAAVAQPRRFSGGTLVLSAGGPDALALQHQATELIARLNLGLGRQMVERLRFVQDGGAAAPAGFDPPPPAPPAAPVAVPGLPAGGLHDALARLGGSIAARAGRRP